MLHFRCTLLISALNFISSQQILDEPLIITPLLKAGKYLEAQEKCKVPPLVPDVNSSGYSAFFQIDEESETNLHFWFTPREDTDNWKEYPLVLWLQGGFGLTSFRSALQENLFPYDTPVDGVVKKTDKGLTQFVNVLLLDNPGVGFSYTNDASRISTNFDMIADEVYAVLEQFFLLFPDLSQKVFLGGASGAGVKVYALGKMILERKRSIHLGGIILGDAVTFLESDFSNLPEYLRAFGLIDKTGAWNVSRYVDKIAAYDNSYQYDLESKFFYQGFIKEFTERIGFKEGGLQDIREGFVFEDYWLEFLNSPEIRSKLHVGTLNFTVLDPLAQDRLLPDTLTDQIPKLEFIVNENVPVLRFNGQFDGVQPYQGTMTTLLGLDWFGLKCFHSNQWKRKLVYIEGKLFGYSRKCHRVWEIFALKASHVVYLYVPKQIWMYVDKFAREFYAQKI